MFSEKYCAKQNAPTASPVFTGGLGTLTLHPSPLKPLFSAVGLAAVNAKFVLLFTVIWAVGVAVPVLLVTVTLTVPLVTIVPDHWLFVLLLVTGLLVPSCNESHCVPPKVSAHFPAAFSDFFSV